MAKKRVIKAKVPAPASSARPVLQFRVHEYLYEALKKDAAEKKLTLSEAAAAILSEHMHEKPLFSGIEKTMVWISSAFWHAAKMKAFELGLSHNYDDSGTWLQNPECYRAGVLAAINSLLGAPAISSPAERQKTAESVASLAGQFGTYDDPTSRHTESLAATFREAEAKNEKA